ncbi:hypothetical protein PIB30_039208 [Stylosanthes scabra]|uniref:Ubiquitin-like protease family profile domain-containing protein n=1 Tax=Stylosanthes scabra TaxID=79078 RepID=A0ABU6QES8_9FABA|nr:hypothetical protein [Stylosanthes scabra]
MDQAWEGLGVDKLGRMVRLLILALERMGHVWAMKRKNLQREESKKKRTKQPVQEPPIDPAIVSLGNDESNAESASLFVEVHEQHHQQPHQQPPEEEEPPHEQPPPQQPHQVYQQQQPQQELIDISSSSEGAPEPTPNRVLIPKAESDIVSSPRDRLEAHSQSLVEVVPIYPTQEVIAISSNSKDEHEPQLQPIKVVVPKVEDCLVTSPNSKLITEVLMSMGQDLGQQPPPESPHDPSIPSFSLNLDFSRPLGTHEQPPKALEEEFPLTARTISVIESMDELVSGHGPPLETPQPTQVIKDDLEERVAIWATVSKGDNDFETIFRLRGHQVLEALRRFMSMAPKSYIDIQVVSLMCHVLNAEEDERFEKLVYCVPPEILSNILNQMLKWAGAPSILKKGSQSLLPKYINIPQQPNDFDCAMFVMKWMELINLTILAS